MLTYHEITQEYKLPPLEACSDCQIHVLNRGSVLPATCLIHSSNSPHASGTCAHRERIFCLLRHQRFQKTHAKMHICVEIKFTIEAEEGIDGGAYYLLHREVVVQRHLLHPCHQAFIRVHCMRSTKQHQEHV